MLPLRNTLYSEGFRRLLGSGIILSRNCRTFHGCLRVFFKHRNVGHHTEPDSAVPLLSQHPFLLSQRVSELPGPDSIVEPYDVGYSDVPATVAHFICTSPCWRFSGVNIDPSRTIARLCDARNNLLHLVLETLTRPTLTNPLEMLTGDTHVGPSTV